MKIEENEVTSTETNEDTDNATVGTYVDRMNKLNAIGDSADRVRAEELMEYNEDGSSDPFVAPAAVDEQDQAVEVAAKEVEAAPVVQQPQKIVRKINGRDVEITDDMIVRAQKIVAADTYLEEAKRQANELLKQKPSQADVSAAAKVEDDLAFYVEKANAIQMGTPEEAAAVLRELLSKKSAPVINESDIAKKIDEKFSSHESKRRFDEAFAKFSSEYGDIVGDPMAFKLAQELDNSFIKQGDKRDFYDRFKASGDAVRDWLGKKGVPAQTQTKEQAKATAALRSVPKQATAKHTTQQVDDKEESASDVIASMRKNRAGPKWMNGSTQ